MTEKQTQTERQSESHKEYKWKSQTDGLRQGQKENQLWSTRSGKEDEKEGGDEDREDEEEKRD